MFNSIHADLLCAVRGQVAENVEIQIKWQEYEARALDVYRLADVLPQIEPEYDNTWIRTDYICPVCSKHTMGRRGMTYIKTDDQRTHLVFVEIRAGKICQILTEDEFAKTGVTDFVVYL